MLDKETDKKLKQLIKEITEDDTDLWTKIQW